MLNITKKQPPTKTPKKYKSQAKSAEYWEDLKQRFEENTRIIPFEEWADGYEMPSEDATEPSLNGLTPEEIQTLYRELGGLELSAINEQLIIKKAIVADVQFWKEEIERLIEAKHKAFHGEQQLKSNLGFVNTFLFMILVQTGCVKYSGSENPKIDPQSIQAKIEEDRERLEERGRAKAQMAKEMREIQKKLRVKDRAEANNSDRPEAEPMAEIATEINEEPVFKKKNGRPKKYKFELVKLNLPFLIQTIQAINDFDGAITCATTFAVEISNEYFPGSYKNKDGVNNIRHWMYSQGLFSFDINKMRLSTKENIFPFIPTVYRRIDIARLFTFAMALEQVILGREKERKEDPEKANLIPKYAAEEGFKSGLPAHKVNFLRLAFNELFEGIAEWNRVAEDYGSQGWLPSVHVGLSELEELIWTKFCRTLRWATGFAKPKPKPS